MTSVLTVAAAQYSIEQLNTWLTYQTKIIQFVRQAVQHGAQLLVFPEYASLELIGMSTNQNDDELASLQCYWSRFLEFYAQLAQDYHIYLLAGTFPVQCSSESYRNRAYFFTPEGNYVYQDKLQLTRFEREQTHLEPGEGIKIFDMPWGKVGVAICYDSEFPFIVRKQVEAGAQVILVPSCTDTLAGFYRVHLSCRARALENQCYVVQACTIGEAPWSTIIDKNVGCAGIYSPIDTGFPNDGLLALGELNQPQWVVHQLIPQYLDQVRHVGQVLNHQDWRLQQQMETMPVEIIKV